MAQKKDKNTGKWYFYGNIKLPNGEIKQYKKRGFDTKKECVKAEVFYRENINNPLAMTLDDVFNEYVDYIKVRKSIGTIESEKQRYKKISAKFGKYRIDKITGKEVVDWQHELLEEVSISYINTITSTFNNIFNYVNDIKGVDYNPIRKVKKMKDIKLKDDFNIWSIDEFNDFFNEIDDLRDKVVFRILFFTGMRRGELLALTWKDFNGTQLKINKSFTKHGLQPPKTPNSYRTIDLDRQTIQLIKEYKKYCFNYDDFSDDWYISNTSKPMAFETLRRKKEKYIKKACVKNIRIHDFRHSHISFLINQNMPLPAIADRVGDTIEIILNTYSHLLKESNDKVLNLLNQF